MDGPPTEEATHQIEELIIAVEELRRRVLALEQRSTAPVLERPTVSPAQYPHAPEVWHEAPTGLLTAIGRGLLGIAGAYLLRAFTESGFLPSTAGAIAGLIYAGAWLAFILRIKSANRTLILSQAITGSAIAAPLLWEATTRFHTLGTSGAAVALAVFLILGQTISRRAHLLPVAGVTAAAGAATALVLIVATRDPVPFALAITIGALAAEVGACQDLALTLRWILAYTADFCAFLLLYLVTRPHGLPEGYAPVPMALVAAIPTALAGIYLASLLIRTVARRLEVRGFEIIQAAAIVVLAIASGLYAEGSILVGAVCLAAGAVCYLIAFTGHRQPINFHVYATYALLLSATGALLMFPGRTAAFVWSIAAVLLLWLGNRNGNTLRMHSALYLFGAAVVSELLAATFDRMLGPAGHNWQTLGAASASTAIAIALGCALLWRNSNTEPWKDRVAASILCGLLCWTLAGLVAGGLIGTSLNAPLVSTVRTAIVAVIAIAIAWFARRAGREEFVWILYPWMAFGGLKLFAQDFQQGSPATLFLSLFLYGGTLIALPRILRRAEPAQRGLS